MKNKILFPKPIIILFYILSTILLLIYSLALSNPLEPIKYFSYLYSTYCLVIVISNTKRFARYLKTKITNGKLYSKIKKNLYKNAKIKQYCTDKIYRIRVNLILATIMNFIFIFLKLHDGIKYHSNWFISFAIYYIALTITRIYLLTKYNKKWKRKEEYKVYKRTGYIMMILNLILTGMIIQMIRKNVATLYPGHVIYLSALYTFYFVTVSTIGIIKYRKNTSPILTSIKNIDFFASLVSILILQTTMIATFDSDNLSYMKLMNTITGTIVIILVLLISTFVIIKGTSNSKKDNE